MGRAPCCSKVGLRRGPWSTKEDKLLTDFIQENGEGQWRSLPKKAGLLRCGKSCRLRWMNYLRPGIKRGNISQDEEDLIVRLHGLLGNRWSLIAGRLPGRTDNEIKNYWNTYLFKKLKNAGITPKLHKDLPKPLKNKKSTTAVAATSTSTATVTAKKKKKLKKASKVQVPEPNNDSKSADHAKEDLIIKNDIPKTKVYLPKPIRVSSKFSRSSSYDSLLSGTSSSDPAEKVAEVVSYVPTSWPPLFEMEDGEYGMYDGVDMEDFLGSGCVLPVFHHSDSISGDVNMLDKVYDEYLQLL